MPNTKAKNLNKAAVRCNPPYCWNHKPCSLHPRPLHVSVIGNEELNTDMALKQAAKSGRFTFRSLRDTKATDAMDSTCQKCGYLECGCHINTLKKAIYGWRPARRFPGYEREDFSAGVWFSSNINRWLVGVPTDTPGHYSGSEQYMKLKKGMRYPDGFATPEAAMYWADENLLDAKQLFRSQKG